MNNEDKLKEFYYNNLSENICIKNGRLIIFKNPLKLIFGMIYT